MIENFLEQTKWLRFFIKFAQFIYIVLSSFSLQQNGAPKNVKYSIFEAVLELESLRVEGKSSCGAKKDEKSIVCAFFQSCSICKFTVASFILQDELVAALLFGDKVFVFRQPEFVYHQMTVVASLLPLLFNDIVWQVRVIAIAVEGAQCGNEDY